MRSPDLLRACARSREGGAGRLLADWGKTLGAFRKVMPTDYKAVLARISGARHILIEDSDREMREIKDDVLRMGSIVADRAGHAMHTALVSRLLRDKTLWEETSVEESVESSGRAAGDLVEHPV